MTGGPDLFWGSPDHERGSEHSDREFGWWIGGILIALGLWPFVRGGPVRVSTVACGLILIALACFVPDALGSANRLWQRFGMLLSRVTNPLIAGLLFFAVITPFGLLLRSLGRLSIQPGIDHSSPTYWQGKEETRSADRMRMQF